MKATEKATVRTWVWTPDSQHVYTQRRIESACIGNQSTLRAFADWLVEVQGLAPTTVLVRVRYACVFVDALTLCGKTPCTLMLQSLKPEDIEDFFVSYGQRHGMGARRHVQTAMRSFLIFAAAKGWADSELINAVPILSSYRLSTLPRVLSDEELSMLLSSPWRGGKCTCRDRAIIYLLATYGVRRGQISALQFPDINWIEKTITFTAHKRGRSVHHTLTQAVAESLAEYLQNERPASDCSYVFLRHHRPCTRLSPDAITTLVASRMAACGLSSQSAHSLRHTFATRLLRTNQPIKVIADLLGHQSLDSVAIYAKVDYARLLEVAAEWPEVTP